MSTPWIPRACDGPSARPGDHAGAAAGRSMHLLINPFYRKDPHASFGKHVLTPSLALDEHCRRDSAGLGGRLLGREPAAGPAAVGPVSAGRGNHGSSDVRGSGIRAGAVVPPARGQGRPGRPARPVVSRRGRSARRCPRDRRGGADLAGDPPRRRGGHAPARCTAAVTGGRIRKTRPRAGTWCPVGAFSRRPA